MTFVYDGPTTTIPTRAGDKAGLRKVGKAAGYTR